MGRGRFFALQECSGSTPRSVLSSTPRWHLGYHMQCCRTICGTKDPTKFGHMKDMCLKLPCTVPLTQSDQVRVNWWFMCVICMYSLEAHTDHWQLSWNLRRFSVQEMKDISLRPWQTLACWHSTLLHPSGHHYSLRTSSAGDRKETLFIPS